MLKNRVVLPFLDEYIYVTDKTTGTIVVLDKEGNFQRQSSKDELSLSEPTVIKTDGKLLYVIDSGNNQLKVLTTDFELVKSLDLIDSDPNTFSTPNIKEWDFEIIDEKIYLAMFSLFDDNAMVYELNENNEFKKIADGFVGYLANFNDELMAVNSFEFRYVTQRHSNDAYLAALQGKKQIVQTK